MKALLAALWLGLAGAGLVPDGAHGQSMGGGAPDAALPAAAATHAVDAATLASRVSAERGDEFHVDRHAVTDFPAIAFRIETVRLASTDTNRTIVYAIDSGNHATAFYDSGFVSPECGVPDVDVPGVALVCLAGRALVAVDEQRSQVGCCGGDTADSVTALYYDAEHGLRKVLALERSAVNFHDDECGHAIRTSYRTSHISSNGCPSERNCACLSVFTISSDRKYREPFGAYGRNKDFSAVVGLR